MAVCTSIGHYSPEQETIENYLTRLESWLAVNDIEDAGKKRDSLLAEVGPKPFATLTDLSFPTPVRQKTFAELQELLTAHYKTGNTTLSERLKLHRRQQGPQETIADYIVALKQLAINCNFGETLEERLRETFAFGVSNPKLRKRLLEESQKENFSWTSAKNIALAMETVDRDTANVRQASEARTNLSVNRIRGNSGSQTVPLPEFIPRIDTMFQVW